MVLERTTLDTWRKSFLQDIQLDAHAIACLFKFLPNSNFTFDSSDYQKDISLLINSPNGNVSIETATFYKTAIANPNANNMANIRRYTSFRTAIFLQEFIAPVLLFPSTYHTEKQSFSDPSNVYKSEKSLEIVKLLEILTSRIGTYPDIIPLEQQETHDMDNTVNKLLNVQWDLRNSSQWDPLDATKDPYMDDELRRGIEEIQKYLLIDGIFFDEGLASRLIAYWNNCFFLRATNTEVLDFLENEIPRFTQYFESAKPSQGASELFNLAVLYVKDYYDKANSRGNLQLINEKTIPATIKMMRRLNFTTSNEQNKKMISFPYEYQLIYTVIKGKSKLAQVYDSIPSYVCNTVPCNAPAGNSKPNPGTPPIDTNNLFPGDFLTGSMVSSFSNAYKYHKRFIERYDQNLKNAILLLGRIVEIKKASELHGYNPVIPGVIY